MFLDADTSSTLVTEQAAQRNNSELELMKYISNIRCLCANSETKMCSQFNYTPGENTHYLIQPVLRILRSWKAPGKSWIGGFPKAS